jgi:PIN domain nuclease of toxin-antitoxin system
LVRVLDAEVYVAQPLAAPEQLVGIRGNEGGVIPIGEDIAVEAARLRGRHRSLRLPDALIIASGDLLDADSILTGDRKWTAVSHRVQVVA